MIAFSVNIFSSDSTVWHDGIFEKSIFENNSFTKYKTFDIIDDFQLSSSEVNSSQISFGEVGLIKPGKTEVNFSQISTKETSLAQASTAQISFPQISFEENNLIQGAATQIGSTQIGVVKTSSPQVGVTQISPAQVGSFKMSVFQVDTSQVRATQIDSLATGNKSLQVGISEVSSTQIDAIHSFLPQFQKNVNSSKISFPSSILLQQLLNSYSHLYTSAITNIL